MTRRLLVGYLTIAVFALLVLEVPLGLTYARGEVERVRLGAERDASVISSVVEEPLEGGSGAVVLPAPVVDYARDGGVRIVVVDRDGIAVADTDGGPGEDYGTRPEVVRALAGETATGARFSDTVGTDLSYVAVPVAGPDGVLGVVRITYPTDAVQARIRANWLRLALVAAMVVATTALFGIVLGRSVTRPLARVGTAATGLAEGHLEQRAPDDRGPPEVRELARRFNDMAARLQDLVSSQQAFVLDASHQLRSPLAAMRLELEVLEEDVRGEDRAGVHRALDAATRLGRIVDGLLALARADGGTRTATVLDAGALATARVRAWEPVAHEAGRRLARTGDARAAAVGVPDYLDQVLDNLVDNALRAAPPGTTVEVDVADGPDVVVVAVRDHGPGMDDEAKRRAFDRFWRGRAESTDTGTGLGLPIARRLVVASGGVLALVDTPGGGLAVEVRLPRST